MNNIEGNSEMTATETRTFVLDHTANVQIKINELFDSLSDEHYAVDIHYFVRTIVLIATRVIEI